MRVVELFAGAGGMSLGLSQAGMTVAMALEFEEAMVRTYRKNLQRPVRMFGRGDHAHRYDLNDFPDIIESIMDVRPDIVVGGPPCQDFSPAGKRIEGERAKLTAYYAQLLCIVRPQWFVLENVKAAFGSEQYAAAKRLLKSAGYGLSENILLASHYGVPQRRRRLILIGRLGEQDGFLDSAIAAKASKKEMSIRDLVGDRFGAGMYFHPRDPSRKAVWSTSAPAPTIRSASGRNLPESFQVRPDVDDLVTGDIYNPSMRELALLQGFPAWWNWEGETKGKVATMIGNAVPPPLAKAVGEVILARHLSRSIPAIPIGFADWLAGKGYGKPSIRNVKSRINAGRRLLRCRTFANTALEVGELEEAFDRTEMTVKARSDIRISLRLLREYLATMSEPKSVPSKSSLDFAQIRANARRVKWLLSPSAYAQIVTQAELTEDDDPYDDYYETDEHVGEIEDELETA
ncbi:DNA cytosine methyltransferase [Rhizobium leguminosarum]|uniref:DNA cytosine methyltransferase n=1 Tax=Rhizobium leguminosarum TaxID=384 RepID=UPI001C97CC2D|nr:DNA cytosine methyltransferase [Rhizobium leguminosarum]MBY5329561.1 DNA cytosine methyltransferase [Rhizobium leguminosarum]